MKVFKRITLCSLFAVFNFWNTASSQSCTGTVSTGQNLVTNGDFSNLYNGWTHDPGYTNYTPCTGCWSVPGNIYAGSVPQSFNPAFANIQDHSPSGDNNFLMVDGICTVGIDLWRQSNIPIIPNTNYYFSVWITSLSPASPDIAGTLNFNINGVDLPTTIAAPGTVGTWIRFPGVVWNSGLNPPSSITISIQNTTVTGCDVAVDFAIDDITFTQGCDFGVTGPQPNLGADFSICGKTVPFNINPNLRPATAASPNLTYTWYKGTVQQSKGMGSSFYNFPVSTPGVYTVCVDSAGSCPKSDQLTITSDYSVSLGPAITLCNSPTATLDAVYTGPGVSYQWFNNSVAINNETNRTLVVSKAGTYSVTVHDPICGDQTASVNVTSNLPTSVDGTFCPRDGVNANLSATAGTGSYNWYTASSGGNAIATGNIYSPVLSGPGPYTFYVQNSNGTCLRVPAVATLLCPPCTTTQAPARVYSPDSVFCSGTISTIRLRVVGGSGSKLVWYTGSCGGTPIASNTTGAEVVITAPQATTTYYARWETAGCFSNCGSVAVTPVSPPDASNSAGPGQNLCNVTSTTLAAHIASPSGASGLWTVVSGTGSLATPGDPHSAVSGLVAGDLILNWKVINSPCIAFSAQVTIHVDTLPDPQITGASAIQCSTATGVVYSTAFNHSGSTYTWSKTGSLVITGHPGNTAILDIGASGGTLTVTESKGACTRTNTLNITSVEPLNSTSAGPDQHICNSSSVTLAAMAPAAPTTGFWAIISGAGALDDMTKPDATVTGLAEGDLLLRWNIRNSPCADKTDDVIIHKDVLAVPVITGAAFTQCSTAAGIIYSTTVNNSPGSSYTWTAPGNPNTLHLTPGAYNTVKTDVGASGGTLMVTETKGACSLSDSRNITSVQPPDVSAAGADQKICNLSSVTLAANTPSAPSAGSWEIISGTGSIGTADLSNPDASVTGLAEGDLVLRWVIRNSPCAESADTVTIHKDVLSAPVITGASLNQCSTATGVVYSTTVNNSPGSSYTWTASGNPNTLHLTPGADNTVKTDVGASGGTLMVTETKGACSLSDSKNITSVRPPDVSTAGADQQICNLRAVTLAANTPSAPSAGSWEIISGTGSIGTADLSNPNASVTGLAEGDLVLRWVIRNSPCAESADTITIHKDVLAAPILALTGASYDTCAFTTGITYSTTVDHSPGSTYSWAASGNPNTLVIASAANNRVVVNVGASGGILTVMEVRGACSLSASGNITIKPNITKADAGADQTICVDNTMLQATLLSFGKGQWTVIEGNGIFTDSSDAHTLVAGLNYGLNIFRWTVKGCGGPLTDDVNVIVGASQMKIGPLTGPTDTLCVGTPRMLTLTVSGGSSHYFYVWKSSDSSFNSVLTYTPVIVVPLINTTTYYVYAVDSVNHGCMSMSDSIVVQSISKQNLTMNNLMTPNNDNMNDKFIVRDIETLQKALPGTSLEIFNEWGSRVFQTDSYDNTWEAPALTDGVYYYHLKAGCGSDVYKGWVQILR
jgi:hypothetical protein